jgi:hypothetical protein
VLRTAAAGPLAPDPPDNLQGLLSVDPVGVDEDFFALSAEVEAVVEPRQ